jgi:hypothetical protein
VKIVVSLESPISVVGPPHRRGTLVIQAR